ncbi:hypothetical protein NKH18_48545 [Streptomyces sp. M10(2022)]
MPRTTEHGRVNFLVFEDGLQRHTAKEYAFALLRKTPGNQLRPAKPTSLPHVIGTLTHVWTNLRAIGVQRLQDVGREHLEALLPYCDRRVPPWSRIRSTRSNDWPSSARICPTTGSLSGPGPIAPPGRSPE